MTRLDEYFDAVQAVEMVYRRVVRIVLGVDFKTRGRVADIAADPESDIINWVCEEEWEDGY